MREWTKSSLDVQEIAVLLFPRFSNHCLANAVEPLRAANGFLGREAYRWSFVTLDGAAVQSSSGLPVLPSGPLRAHPGGRFLFVVSSYDVQDYATEATARALSAAAQRFTDVVGMDTGAWLMARAGLLDGYRATLHWNELISFAERFDTITAVSDRFVMDGSRLTCGGAMTAFDLVLELIRRTHGEAARLEISAFFLHQTTQPPEQIAAPGASDLIHRALRLMAETIETPLPMTELAKRLNVTQRKLSRAFQNDLGATPQTAYQRLRLSTARRYAQQAMPVSEIAVRCGYRNAAAMSRAFKTLYGQAPSQMRP